MEGMEDLAVGTKPSACGTLARIFSCKTHVDMNSCLTEECLHSMTERALTGSFECRGPITLLVVAVVLSIYTHL
jgi:hypothetical protein